MSRSRHNANSTTPAEDREKQWRAALEDLGFRVTGVTKSIDGGVWLTAVDRDLNAFRPFLAVTDAWSDTNAAWSYGFRLSDSDRYDTTAVEYDGFRVDVRWLCQQIDAKR